MRALLINIKLDIGKIHNMQLDHSGIRGYYPGQIHHLLFSPLRGIRRSMEIDRLYHDASFCYHVACHRRIYTAGKQQHGLSVGAYRHSTGPRYHPCEYIDIMPYFYINDKIRIMHIHMGLRICRKHIIAHVLIYGIGGHRIVLIRPSCLDLKGELSFRMLGLYEFQHLFS